MTEGITNYWGVAININSDGWSNGYGGGSASQTYESGYSAFTVNMRSSASATTFDRRLLVYTVLPSGNILCLGSANIAGYLNITGDTNAEQSLGFRSTEYNLGIAGGTGNYSSSAVAGDMILRTLANTGLIFQSGSGGYGLLIDGSNNISISGASTIGNGLIYLPKPGNSLGILKLGLGGVTGADDTTNMKIELHGVYNTGDSEFGNIIIRTYSHLKSIHNILQFLKCL